MREVAKREVARRVLGLLGALGGVLLSGWWAPTAAEGRAGAWDWPVDGAPAVIRPFAPGPTPYSPGHYGADLRGRQDRPVRAAGAGTVSYAGLVAGRGVVVVQHGSLRTTYEPVAAAVRVGETVSRGDVLGRLRPGHACGGGGVCLHWGLRRGDVYLDPVRLVRAGPVRLLPVPRSDRPPVAPRSAPEAVRARSPASAGPAATRATSSSAGAAVVAAAGLAAAGAAAGLSRLS